RSANAIGIDSGNVCISQARGRGNKMATAEIKNELNKCPRATHREPGFLKWSHGYGRTGTRGSRCPPSSAFGTSLTECFTFDFGSRHRFRAHRFNRELVALLFPHVADGADGHASTYEKLPLRSLQQADWPNFRWDRTRLPIPN